MVGRLLPSDAETDAPATAMTARARRKLTIAVTALCRRGTVRCRTCFEIMFPPPTIKEIIGCADALVEYSSHPWLGTSHDRAISYSHRSGEPQYWCSETGYTRLGDRSSHGRGAPVAAAWTG